MTSSEERERGKKSLFAFNLFHTCSSAGYVRCSELQHLLVTFFLSFVLPLFMPGSDCRDYSRSTQFNGRSAKGARLERYPVNAHICYEEGITRTGIIIINTYGSSLDYRNCTYKRIKRITINELKWPVSHERGYNEVNRCFSLIMTAGYSRLIESISFMNVASYHGGNYGKLPREPLSHSPFLT